MFYYILFCLLFTNVYSYKCFKDKTLDSQLRTCINNSSYVLNNNTNYKYLNVGYDVLLKNFTEENYYYRINDTIITCPLNYVFNGITCKLDKLNVPNKPNNVVCNLRSVFKVDYKVLPADICNYIILDSFDINDKYELTYVNFWTNTTELTEALTYIKDYSGSESVLGVYISVGMNPEFWKGIVERDPKTVANILETFIKKHQLSGVVVRYINSNKLVELLDMLDSSKVSYMINANMSDIYDNLFKNVSKKAKFVNILCNNKNVSKVIDYAYDKYVFDNLNKINIEKDKINLEYSLFGKKYEISDNDAKTLYKNRNITEVLPLDYINMFHNYDNIPVNSICYTDTKICTKEDFNTTDNTPPNCVYEVSDKYNIWLVYKNKLINFMDSNTFYYMNDIRHKNNIKGVYINSLDDDLCNKCNKDYPSYYFTNTIARVTHYKKFNIISKINSETNSYFIKTDKNTSEVPCLNDICSSTGFMEYKCDKQKYIKCVKRNGVFYKYLFSCRNGYKFYPITKKCRKIRV
jgi:hypothetical protein